MRMDRFKSQLLACQVQFFLLFNSKFWIWQTKSYPLDPSILILTLCARTLTQAIPWYSRMSQYQTNSELGNSKGNHNTPSMLVRLNYIYLRPFHKILDVKNSQLQVTVVLISLWVLLTNVHLKRFFFFFRISPNKFPSER